MRINLSRFFRGTGVVLARTQSGGWSYPAFYTMGGASVGFQVGAQASEVVLLIMNEGALSAVMKNQIKLGGEVWSARSFDPQRAIEPGRTVDVVQIEGATAVVYESEL